MNRNNFGMLYLAITVILFSTYEVVSKTLVGKIDPFQINFIRFFIGGLILFAFLLAKKDIYISKKDLLMVALIGVINVVISMNLLQLSLYESDSKASVVAVIFSSNPIFVTLFSALIDKEKIKPYKIMGLLIGLSGIFVVFSDKLMNGALGIRGPIMALFSALSYGLYTVLGRRTSVRIGSLKMNSYSFIAGSLILLPILLALNIPVIKFDYSGLLQVGYLSVFVTGVAYLTYFMGLSTVGASKGSMVFFTKPALASFIAIIFLHEKAAASLFAGTALVILGILIVVYWPILAGSNFLVKKLQK